MAIQQINPTQQKNTAITGTNTGTSAAPATAYVYWTAMGV